MQVNVSNVQTFRVVWTVARTGQAVQVRNSAVFLGDFSYPPSVFSQVSVKLE